MSTAAAGVTSTVLRRGPAQFNMVEHDNCANGRPIVFEVRAGDEGLFVWGQYDGRDWPAGTPACWMIGVQMLEEDTPLPGWPMRTEPGERGYSHVLVIEAPDGVTMRYVGATADSPLTPPGGACTSQAPDPLPERHEHRTTETRPRTRRRLTAGRHRDRAPLEAEDTLLPGRARRSRDRDADR